MRKEPFTVGSYAHVIKRGARGANIVRDEIDRWRFILMLRHFNDNYISENWFRDLMDENIANTLKRPTAWPKQKKIVNILCHTLLDNHFHLLLQEIQEGGISKFMQKLGMGMTRGFNQKYKEQGSIFQGAYKSKTVEDDAYLRYVSVYIQVKNSFELYPDGIKEACANFDKAYDWVANYPYCSLGNYAGLRESLLVDKDILGEIFTSAEYKVFSRDFITGYLPKIEEKRKDIDDNRIDSGIEINGMEISSIIEFE